LPVAFCLVAVMALFAFAASAFAAPVTSTLDLSAQSTDASGDGWSWVASSKTLTLDGIDIEAPNAGLIMPAGSTIIITNGSTNTIAVSGMGINPVGNTYGILAQGALTIQNESSFGPSGTLDVSTAAGAINTYGIYATDTDSATGDLVINGGTVSATSGDSTQYSDGIYWGSGNISITSGVLNATAGNVTAPVYSGSQSFGIGCGYDLIIGAPTSTPTATDPLVNVVGGDSVGGYSIGMYGSTIVFNGGTVTAKSSDNAAKSASGQTKTLAIWGLDNGIKVGPGVTLGSGTLGADPFYNTPNSTFLNSDGSVVGDAAAVTITVPTVEYTVTFDGNGGTPALQTVTREAGDMLGVPEITRPERSGYTWTGWNTKPDGSGESGDVAWDVEADVTFYAQWTKDASSGTSDKASDQGTTESAKTAGSPASKEVTATALGLPKTGDSTTVIVALVCVAIAGAGAAIVSLKRRTAQQNN